MGPGPGPDPKPPAGLLDPSWLGLPIWFGWEEEEEWTLGELSGLWTDEGDISEAGTEFPTPSLIACKALRELLE